MTPNLVTDLEKTRQKIGNLMSDWSAAFKCDDADCCPLFCNLLFELFNGVEEDADTWMTGYGLIEPFTVYLCIMIDKLMWGLVASRNIFTNNNATKDRVIGAYELKPYHKADFPFSKTLENIKDAMDSDKAWDNYSPFLEAMSQSHKKHQLEVAQSS